MMNDSLAHVVTPSLFPLVNDLVRNARIGIGAGNIRVTDVRSGCYSLAKQPNGDRFKLIIPYAAQSLLWDVIFIGNNADHPPDFTFDDKTFLPDPKQLKSLMSWKKNDPQILRHLIEELINCYRNHQVLMVKEFSRLQFEYSSLLQQSAFKNEDIEVQINRKVKHGSVNFLIRLPIDFTKIPPVFMDGNPGEDSAVLLATFHSPDGARITPQLFLSPRVEKALGGSSNLRIPAFPSGGCLMDYVPNVTTLIQNKIEQIEMGFEKRKEYIASFLSYFGTSLLEFDAETLSRLSFLFEWNEFCFILHISLPLFFPHDKPIMMFQSIYHAAHGQPFHVTCQDYPYSPRWSGNEMAERARTYMLDFIPLFQKNSIRSMRI